MGEHMERQKPQRRVISIALLSVRVPVTWNLPLRRIISRDACMACAVPYRWKLIAWDPGVTHLIPTDSAVLYSSPCMGDAVRPRRAKFESVAILAIQQTTRVFMRS
jgi:hypothetical protein